MFIILAIIALGILILVHELGHFTAAKLSGVWVERFSIGFGPIIWSKKRGDTEYALSAIPLGGYVKLHRMFEDEEAVEGRESQAFYNKSLIKKLFVITAGVLFNIIFAVMLFISIFMLGYKTYAPVVGTVTPGGATEIANMQEGDVILTVNDTAIRSWEEYLEILDKSGEADLTVSRGGQEFSTHIKADFQDYTHPATGEEMRLVDVGADFAMPAAVGSVTPSFPADKSGIKKGDIITSIDGNPVSKWADIGTYIRPRADMLTEVLVQRDGDTLRIGVTPQANENGDGILGIVMPDGDVTLKENPVKAIRRGVEHTASVSVAIVQSIGQLITGKVSKDNLGGPILIVQEGARSAESGYERYLSFIALISINLAILNILPVPVLDGGYVIMFIYEAIRRKRVSINARAKGQMVGMALLGLLMVFAFYNDIFRFLK